MSQWPKYAHTLPELFYNAAAKWGGWTAIRYKRAGQWLEVKWSQLHDDVVAFAHGLVLDGLGDRAPVALLSQNRYEWIISDFAITSTGGIVVPIYPTNTAEQVAYILNDSGSTYAVVEDAAQLAKIQAQRANLPNLKRVIVIDGSVPTDDFVTTFAAVTAAGKGRPAKALEARWRAVDPEALTTLIYTSGTTGNPKGVMLNHRNLVSNVIGIKEVVPITAGWESLSFLPLCHSFGRMEVLGFLLHQGTVNLAESIEKISDNLGEVRPTALISVPRLLEKVYARIMGNIKTAPPIRQKLFAWALGVGKAAFKLRAEGKVPGPWLGLQLAIAQKLVFSKILARLGGRLQVLAYGAAPLAVEIQEFFSAIGLTALEAYGLSETSPGLTGNRPERFKLGTVGLPWPETQIRIADDGEILARGPQIMMGYHNRPKETAEALADGWFHTGDIGELDADGFLKITDRKRDIMKTSGGKMIAPQNLENAVKLRPGVEQVCVIGDNRKYVSALIVPNWEWLDVWAKENGVSGDRAAIVQNKAVVDYYQEQVAAVNENLAQFEKIKRFSLVADPFTVENNMLTPTMKVKRREVVNTYAAAIESMYPRDAEG